MQVDIRIEELKTDIRIPLVVDLDGTLIKSDMLFESVFLLMKKSPLTIFLLFIWIIRGVKNLKNEIAQRTNVDVASLPYNLKLIDFLRKEFLRGRSIYLATATNVIYAEKIAAHLNIFTGVFGSDAGRNLKGITKLKLLIEKFGEKKFDYIGDSNADLEIFPSANAVILVNASVRVCKKAAASSNVVAILNEDVSLLDYLKLMRVHQWLKNLLLFLPIFTSHNWFNFPMILLCTVGFAALSIGASGTYILNDLFDISDDRKHPRKKFRSLASGRISILNGGLLAICLIAVSIISSYFLNSKFFVILLIYYFLTLSYSFVLKRYILIDSILLASLYTLRVIAGAQLTNVELSFWLMSFSIFIFFSLALIKRCTELQLLENIGKKYAEGRDYNTLDISSLRSMGISSGFLSVIVFAMYINSTDVLSLYSNPKILWLICPALLYLVNRLWIKTGRGEMHDDPIVFALEDRASQLIVAIVVCLILISTYL